jgi:hypothetical protein
MFQTRRHPLPQRFVARELYNDIQAITRTNTTQPPLEIAA